MLRLAFPLVSLRSLLLSLGVAVLLAASSGCASNHPSAGVASHAIAPSSQPQHPNPNAPYVVPAPPHPRVPSPFPVTAANAAPCDPAILSIEEVAGNSRGAFRSLKLAFRNRGSLPCRLSGYPIVALLDTRGQNLGSIAMERISPSEVLSELGEPAPPASGSAPASGSGPEVVLMPHAVAAFQVVWTTGPDCTRVARIVATAPGTQRAFAVSQPMRVCEGRLQVTQLSLDQEDD